LRPRAEREIDAVETFLCPLDRARLCDVCRQSSSNSLLFLCPLDRARLCDIAGLEEQWFGPKCFYALLIGRGFATARSVQLYSPVGCFYALLIGRGFATIDEDFHEALLVSFLCPLDRARLCDGSAFSGWVTCGDGSGCEHRVQERSELITVGRLGAGRGALTSGDGVARTGAIWSVLELICTGGHQMIQ
jgi:hypothetical protein